MRPAKHLWFHCERARSFVCNIRIAEEENEDPASTPASNNEGVVLDGFFHLQEIQRRDENQFQSILTDLQISELELERWEELYENDFDNRVNRQ